LTYRKGIFLTFLNYFIDFDFGLFESGLLFPPLENEGVYFFGKFLAFHKALIIKCFLHQINFNIFPCRNTSND